MEGKGIFRMGCLIVAILMVVCSIMPLSISTEPTDTTNSIMTLQMVYNTNPSVLAAMKGEDLSVVESYDSFTLINISEEKAALLEDYGYEVSDMADRTMISVPGYEFNTMIGAPFLPLDFTAKEAVTGVKGLYIVQMIGPVKNEWVDSMVRAGAEPLKYVSNNAYEVRMTPEVAKAIGALGCVGWVGIYEPAYKISPELTGYDVIVTMIGGDIPTDAVSYVRSRLSVRQESTISNGYIFYGLMLSHEAMAEIAASPYVQFIEPYIIPELHDEMGMQITGGYAWINDPDSNINTPYRTLGTHGSYANQLGWDGSGVTVGIADSGGGDGTTPNMGHNDFTGRVIGGIDLGATVNGWNDQHGHGTHCAGLMAGDTYEGNGLIYAGAAKYYVAMGQAHEAQIYVEQIFEGTTASFDAPADNGDILTAGYAGGARVHSNSWGSETNGAYSASDAAYDTRVRDASDGTAGNQQMIVVCSAGNAGSATGTIGSPGNGKNVITVGSYYNYMPDGSSYGYSSTDRNNPDTVSSFSSRGWSDYTGGGRIKPDIAAPGEETLSTKSPQATAALYGTYTPDNRYQWCSGTSQACPTVTGGAAVVYQWGQAKLGTAPSPAMVKALLINSAIDMGTADIPNQNEGWGRMYLPPIVNPTSNWILKDSQPELTTGGYAELTLSYVSNSLPLKITLAWTDKNAVSGDTTPLINNLDLRLTSSGGSVYHGNAFTGGVTPAGSNPSVSFDINADGWDETNNVECIYIPPAQLQTGTYTLRVTGFSVGGDADNDGSNDQDYSLAIYNAAQYASAASTGPIGATSNSAVTLTYNWIGLPTSVNLYYTKTAGTSWTLAGNDGSVDGSFPYTITSGTGSYGWIASAVGGNTIDPSPPTAGTTPEATALVYDTTAPAAPTGFTVQHWGPDTTTSITTEIRYMRGDQQTVNTLTAYQLGTVQSTVAGGGTARTQTGGAAQTVVWGMRAWKRSSTDTETEITGGSMAATVSRTANAAGLQSNTWDCPELSMATTDSLVLRVYDQIGTGAITERAAFTTAQLGATQITAGTWTVYYYTVRTTGGSGMNQWTGSTFWWGTTTYNSRVENFQYGVTVPSDPLLHNSLNWTHSGTDVDHFNVYRATVVGGPYTLIGSSPVGTNTYVDSLKGAADATLWWYRVRAVDAAGNEETNVNNVQELGVPTNPAYAIPLTGKAANSWVFVSFPSAMSGNIQTILNDATTGDSGTTWTVAKWFNIQDKADPWKTYRVGSSVNDMPTLTNQMGVWLWITANGGDQKLTLSSYVANSTVNVVINLKAGWNMVGYPTAISRAETATLTNAFIDYVASWQAASPYLTQHAKGATLMVPGNAYWVHTTADCTWTVNP